MKHIFTATANPSAAPAAVGHHWVNTAAKRHYVSVGTADVSDWLYVPKMSDIGGGGGLTYVTQTILDNQSSLIDVVDLVLDSNDFRAGHVEYTMIRTDGSVRRREYGDLFLVFDDIEGWRLDRSSRFDDVLNLANSIQIDTVTGQVGYKSDAMGGTHDGLFSWAWISQFASEGI